MSDCCIYWYKTVCVVVAIIAIIIVIIIVINIVIIFSFVNIVSFCYFCSCLQRWIELQRSWLKSVPVQLQGNNNVIVMTSGVRSLLLSLRHANTPMQLNMLFESNSSTAVVTEFDRQFANNDNSNISNNSNNNTIFNIDNSNVRNKRPLTPSSSLAQTLNGPLLLHGLSSEQSAQRRKRMNNPK